MPFNKSAEAGHPTFEGVYADADKKAERTNEEEYNELGKWDKASLWADWFCSRCPGLNLPYIVFMRTNSMDLDDMVGLCHAISLVTTLLLAVNATVPMSLLFGDVQDMDKRIWAGEDTWSYIFASEGVEDITELGISARTTNITIHSLEACVGWRFGMTRTMFSNYRLTRAPSTMLNHSLAMAICSQIGCLMLCLILIASAIPIRNEKKSSEKLKGNRFSATQVARRRASQGGPTSAAAGNSKVKKPIAKWMHWSGFVYTILIFQFAFGIVATAMVIGCLTCTMFPNYAAVSACEDAGWELDPLTSSPGIERYIGGSFIGRGVLGVNNSMYQEFAWLTDPLLYDVPVNAHEYSIFIPWANWCMICVLGAPVLSFFVAGQGVFAASNGDHRPTPWAVKWTAEQAMESNFELVESISGFNRTALKAFQTDRIFLEHILESAGIGEIGDRLRMILAIEAGTDFEQLETTFGFN